MAHQNNDIDNADQPYEDFDQWELACFQCHKPISADRPPNYNAENCSCVEVGTRSNATGEYYSQPMVREQPMYHYNATTQAHYHNQSPQSYASSSLSGPCPEGPERRDPNIPVGTGYLPLGPAVGLNEVSHQRAASFHSDMSYPMLRFLGERDLYEPYATEHVPVNTKFLPQDPFIQSHISKKVQKGTKRSKQSYMSVQSSTSAETSFGSWGLDPLTETGAWAGDGGNLRPGDGYALALSGLTDFHINDDTN
jgi:hypothetical protein